MSKSQPPPYLSRIPPAVYNEPVSNMLQRDVHGNDLRLPTLERKLRRFAECFAEDVAVRSVRGEPAVIGVALRLPKLPLRPFF